jgi:hypothetical protein
MSAWRQAIRVLYAQPGHCGTLCDCELAGIEGAYSASGLKYLSRLDLAKPNTARGKQTKWTLTQRGIDYCEGRLTLGTKSWRGGPGRPGFRLVATWLSSLPRDIRITQQETA